MKRTWIVLASASALAACTASEAENTQRAVEGAVDGFFISIFQWFLVMFLLAAVGIVLWSLLIGGAAAAIIAGLQRMRGNREPTDAPRAAAGTYDPVGIGMTVFGVVLLLSSFGAVCSVNSGPTGGEVSIPIPIIVLGTGLVLAAKRRARRRSTRESPTLPR